MSRDIPAVAARGFAAAAEVYERARPGYPDEAVAWLARRAGIGPGRDVLDLAAGTGKLTRLLVPLGARIVAVEPVAEMRAQLRAAVPGVEALDGTAEAIPLPDASLDAVTVAQAWHWFRHEEALRELHRVLRPGGTLVLLWNVRDLEDPLQAALEAVLGPYLEGIRRHYDLPVEPPLERSGLFGPIERFDHPYEQRLELAALLDRQASTSVLASLPEGERRAVLGRMAAAAAPFAEPFVLRYTTSLWAADRR